MQCRGMSGAAGVDMYAVQRDVRRRRSRYVCSAEGCPGAPESICMQCRGMSAAAGGDMYAVHQGLRLSGIDMYAVQRDVRRRRSRYVCSAERSPALRNRYVCSAERPPAPPERYRRYLYIHFLRRGYLYIRLCMRLWHSLSSSCDLFSA